MREIQSIRKRMGGEPTFKNRRLTISFLLADLAEGTSIEEFAKDFDIEQEHIKNALLDIAENIRSWMRPKVRWELWKDKDNMTFAPIENILKMKLQGLIPPDAEYIWHIEAESHNQAMEAYNKYMGYRPYHPMLNDNGEPYPECEGDTI